MPKTEQNREKEMKYVQSITFRALCALTVGALLIAFPDKTTTWLVIIIGVLFLIPGLVSIEAYFRLRGAQGETMRPLFPLLGIGSLLFGLLLIVCAAGLEQYMKYVLAAFLILAGITQLVSMFRIRSVRPVGAFFFVMPLLVTLAGLFIFLYRQLEPATNYLILGVTSVVYGLVELVSAIYFRKVRRQLDGGRLVAADDETAAEPVEALPETPASDAEALPEPEEPRERIDFSPTDAVEE